MSASPSTKAQLNFKTPAGTLINLYADTPEQLDNLIDQLGDRIPNILATEALFSGAAVVQGAGLTAPAGDAVVNVTSIQDAPSATQSASPQCKHGARVFRESKPGATKKWRAWMCPTPKGTPDQCEPEWLKG